MTTSSANNLTPVGEGDHVIGADAPRLTLVEYGDFGCPHCFAASRPVMTLLDRFDGLRLVWRHLPDPELHPGADLAAELSELAAVHGKFWEAHSLLLTGRQAFSHEDLLSTARNLELDADEAKAALDERTFRPRVLDRCREWQAGQSPRYADVLHRRRAGRGPTGASSRRSCPRGPE